MSNESSFVLTVDDAFDLVLEKINYLEQLYCDELESEFENVLLNNLEKVKNMISIEDDEKELGS